MMNALGRWIRRTFHLGPDYTQIRSSARQIAQAEHQIARVRTARNAFEEEKRAILPSVGDALLALREGSRNDGLVE